MLDPRWTRWIRLFLIGMLAAAPLACAQVVSSTTHRVVAPAGGMCPVGSQGCACTSGGGCDPGLSCSGGICVGGYGDEEPEYMFEDDMAPAEEMIVVESSRKAFRAPKRAAKHGRAGRSRSNSSPDQVAAPAPVAAGSVEPSPPLGNASEASRDPADEVDNARQVIYTATLAVAVFELDAAAELAESLPERYGGWVEWRYDYQLTLRIRAEHLFDAIADLEALGVVLDRTLLAEDVTAEYVDLESRIRVLEELVAQLEALLARATSVEQALEIRVQLDRARLELEAARVRMRQLAELIGFSTLTVSFSPRSPIDALPSSNDPFPWVNMLGVEGTEYR